MGKPQTKHATTTAVERTPLLQKILPVLRFLTFTTGLINMILLSIYWYFMSHLRYQVEDYPWSTILSYACAFALGLGYTYSLLFPSLLGKESRLVSLAMLSVAVLVVKFRVLVPSGWEGCDREMTCTIEFAEVVVSMVLGFLVLPEMVLTYLVARRGVPNGKVADHS
ncbi:hypothetical protein K457DRAFT_263399 [Linnemannia elongata AG-77]|uniref:Uncharacterized protein n=1 Tax=Linnemannia elongata AG-77 TaxID=1314771 RepID=A0A197JEU8_9FUNG|nr:hypothetical protein K457DRAFT_263399 [Linnemannia elongata AG-77]